MSPFPSRRAALLFYNPLQSIRPLLQSLTIPFAPAPSSFSFTLRQIEGLRAPSHFLIAIALHPESRDREQRPSASSIGKNPLHRSTNPISQQRDPALKRKPKNPQARAEKLPSEASSSETGCKELRIAASSKAVRERCENTNPIIQSCELQINHKKRPGRCRHRI